MAKTKIQMQDLQDAVEKISSAFQVPELINAPSTTITDVSGNPRQIADPSKSLRPSLGIERVLFRELIETDEINTASTKEQVFKLSDDDRVRFVGNWIQDTQNTSGNGAVASTSTSDYFEVTFYGTGLNILSLVTNDARDWRASVDGGSFGSNLFINGSSIISAQGFEANNVLKVVSGLTLGTHTVRIMNFAAIGVRFYGVEILNISSSISVTAGSILSGGKRNSLNAATTTAYNSGFDGNPTLNGKGGKVAIYVKDGAVGKAITQTAASPTYFTGTVDHSNEEIIRRINWLQFGSGDVGDDFTTKTTAETDNWFTMPNGSLSLLGNNVTKNNAGSQSDLQQNFSTGGFITLTFIGTGLDLWLIPRSATPSTMTVDIDGVAIGTLPTLSSLNNKKILQKVVAGLPYGAHTIKLTKNASGTDAGILDFVIYGPKEPELPERAAKIGEYYLMANYSATVTNSPYAKSQGVMNKSNLREMVYSGTWDQGTVNNDALYYVLLSTGTVSSYVEYTFWGTGVEINCRDSGVAASYTVNIDGALYTGAATTTAGTWTPGTGTWAGTATLNGARTQISGLSLGLHTVRVTRASGTIRFNGFDIITPIYHNNILKGASGVFATLDTTKGYNSDLADMSKAKAWVRYNNLDQVIEKSYNIAAVTRLTTGQFIVFFKKPFKNNQYTWVNSGPQMYPSAIGSPGSVTNNNVSPGSIVLTQASGGGTATNYEIANIVFFGELQDEEDSGRN